MGVSTPVYPSRLVNCKQKSQVIGAEYMIPNSRHSRGNNLDVLEFCTLDGISILTFSSQNFSVSEDTPGGVCPTPRLVGWEVSRRSISYG